MKRLLISVILVIALLVLPVSEALAATSAEVTVTATPSYIAITNLPEDWTINGITGNWLISENTTYYSNPLGDETTPSATVAEGECYFEVTNSSSVNITLTVNFANFTGGDAMTNGNTGSAGATSFGAYSYYSGMTYSAKVIAKNTGSDALKSDIPDTEISIKWGLEITTRTDDWTSGDTQTSTVTMTATAS